MVARFRDLGGLDEGQLVAGPWGDLSPYFHKLLLAFAESWVAAMSRAQGWEAGDGMLGKVMGEVRRAMSLTVVRANAHCLLERLSQLGSGVSRIFLDSRIILEMRMYNCSLTWSAKIASLLTDVNTLVGNYRTNSIFKYQTWIFCKKNWFKMLTPARNRSSNI